MSTQPSIHKPQLFLERLAEGINLKMVIIPAGTYVMGAPKSEQDSFARERPQHLVRVPSFCMGQTPITQAQWREVASWGQIERKLEPEPAKFKGDRRPVEQVLWGDVQEFCARLSQKTGKDYRLPSEAEWEYACRAESNFQPSMTGEQISQLSAAEEQQLIMEWNAEYLQPFFFGETLQTDLVNYNREHTYEEGKPGELRGETTEVGSFPANNFGLYDMHGNVWEWCEDDYPNSYKDASIDGSAQVNPEGDHGTKIIRGGSWREDLWACRSAYRNGVNSQKALQAVQKAQMIYARLGKTNGSLGFKIDHFGFRVVCCLPN